MLETKQEQICCFIGCSSPVVGDYKCRVHQKYYRVEVRDSNKGVLEIIPVKITPEKLRKIIHCGIQHTIKFDCDGKAFILVHSKTIMEK